MNFKYFLFCSLVCISNLAFSQNKADEILGKWLTEKKDAVVQIFKTSDNKYAGKVIWLEKPLDENGQPIKDKMNPKPELRSRQIMSLIFLGGFEYKNNEWVNGIIYDAESGNTYKAKIALRDKNTLDLRGYVGSPMFGRTTTWTRRNDK